jgi:hypothetical protein
MTILLAFEYYNTHRVRNLGILICNFFIPWYDSAIREERRLNDVDRYRTIYSYYNFSTMIEAQLLLLRLNAHTFLSFLCFNIQLKNHDHNLGCEPVVRRPIHPIPHKPKIVGQILLSDQNNEFQGCLLTSDNYFLFFTTFENKNLLLVGTVKILFLPRILRRC